MFIQNVLVELNIHYPNPELPNPLSDYFIISGHYENI